MDQERLEISNELPILPPNPSILLLQGLQVSESSIQAKDPPIHLY